MRTIRPILNPVTLAINDEATLKCSKCGKVEVLSKRRLDACYDVNVTVETNGVFRTYRYTDICSNCLQELLSWLRTSSVTEPEDITDADIIDAP